MAFDPARLLQTSGLVSESDLRGALELQSRRGGSLPRICHELGVLDEARWARVLARALSLPAVDLTQIDVEPEARGKVPDALLRQILAFPFQLRDLNRTLVVAMAEPQDDAARAQLKAEAGCEIKIGVASYRQIEQMLDKHPNPHSPSGVSAFLAAGKANEVDFDGVELGSAEPPEAVQPDWAEADLVEVSEPTPEPPLELTPEQQGFLRALEQSTAQGKKALRAALDLCVERRVFSVQDFMDHLKK